ncbi:MAG: hypothetical protein Q7K54_02815 [Candidatus Parcubacteria bacterium]|nr:hypothetical protein [Candidatus Parcubacteria bacterium]
MVYKNTNVYVERVKIVPRMDVTLCSDKCAMNEKHIIDKDWEKHTHIIKQNSEHVVCGYSCVCNTCAGINIQKIRHNTNSKSEGWSPDDAWTSNSKLFPKILIMTSLKKKLDINGNLVKTSDGVQVMYVEDRYLDVNQMKNDDAGEWLKSWTPKYVNTKEVMDKSYPTIKDISI